MPINDPDPGHPDPTAKLLETLHSVLIELREVARQRPDDQMIADAIADLEVGTTKLEVAMRPKAAV